MSKKHKTKWRDQTQDSDLEAAAAYLSLLFEPDQTRAIIAAFRKAPVEKRQAKDILRASQTHLLDRKNPDVKKDLKKIKKDEPLNPVLLVRGNGANGATLAIADGYHRICAAWHWDEEAPIACCLVSVPKGREHAG
ncbi:MAG: hypothetical protein JO256_03145 [Alphaproteobacteria bacterium]|nr:hypothetical protein [Alphaproteobacteria bacterium]